jgi:dUTP pyrophosphatase
MDKEIRQLEDELKDLLYQLESAMEKEFQTAQIEEMTGVDMEQLEREFEVSIKETLAYEKVHPEAKDPQYAYESDSGFDLCSTEDIIIEGLGRALAPTGLKFDIPKGFEIQVRPKSGLALKEGLTVLNTPGTVDAGYNGEVKVILYNTNTKSYVVKKGQKIAQAVLCPVHAGFKVNLVNKEVEEKDRGSNGFGSTGI